MNVKELLKAGVLVFDGAMGTMLQFKGLKSGELPEVLNIHSPELIIDIHRGYLDAGAKVITANTFGANEIKLRNTEFMVEEVIDKGLANAKTAIGNSQGFVALDVGPLGELLEPMGTLKFTEAYQLFKRQIVQGVKSGADLILIETMTDLYEAKAAVLAAKENSNLPVFCTMSFAENMRTFSGCSVDSMVMVLQGLGVDALGVNCSSGPEELEPIINRVLEIAKVPVIVQPNAGLPKIHNGAAVFDFSPEEFGRFARRFAQKGVGIIGGCCGTDYRHIKCLTEMTKDITVPKRTISSYSAVCTPTKTVFIDGIKVIGERINPTGKKAFKKALKSENIDYVLQEAIKQVEAGADILDVNVGLPEIDEAETMVKVIKKLQAILDVPLQIDANNPKVIESGLRVYNGKAVVNSVTGEDKKLDEILPLVKKYGAAVIGLTLDEKGIPLKAEERFKIAEKIVKRAQQHGIAKEDVYIDCLTLTAAAEQESVMETIKAIRLVKERLGVKTVLGVSNISFGLPNRDILNRTFLAVGLTAGLDLPIINPLDQAVMDTIKAFRVLCGDDRGARNYLGTAAVQDTKTGFMFKATDNDLFNVIVQGNSEEVKRVTGSLLQTKDPLSIIDEDITPALELVGKCYENGEIFLPQLIQSAETVKESLRVIKEKLGESADLKLSKGKIVLATVKGDIHDIGKNIVKVLLESHGFQVIDLGKDTAVEKVVKEAVKNKVKLVGLSALMTTTVKSMEETITVLKAAYPSCKVMVGGAVLTQDYADKIGADFYAEDARVAVAIAKKVLG